MREASRHASRGVDRRSRRSTEQLDAESLAKLETMIDSEDYPLMTVGELARALGVPREFVFTHAARTRRDLLASAGCQRARFREVRTRRPAALPAYRTIRSTVTGWRHVASRGGLGYGPVLEQVDKEITRSTIAFADGKRLMGMDTTDRRDKTFVVSTVSISL